MPGASRQAAKLPTLRSLLQDLPALIKNDERALQLLSKAIALTIALQLRQGFVRQSGLQLTYARLLRKAVLEFPALIRKASSSMLEETRHLLRIGPEAYIPKVLREFSELVDNS